MKYPARQANRMKIGVKVSRSDYRQMLELRPEAIEFSLEEKDLNGDWVADLDLDSLFLDLVVHAPVLFENGVLVDIVAEDRELRKRSLSAVSKTFALAGVLYESGYFRNIPVVVVHPGGIAKQAIEIPRKRLIESMEKVLSGIDATRCICTLENMPQFYWYKAELYNANIFKAGEEIIEVLKRLRLKLCLDLCHAKLYCNYNKLDFHEYIRSMAPYTRHIHASDASGVSGEGLQIGEGEIDFKSTLTIFKHKDLAIVPEIKDGHTHKGEKFKIAIERLRAIAAELT